MFALADRGGDEGLIHSLIESRVVRLNKISIAELYALSLLKAFHCHRLRIKRKGNGAAMKGFVVCDLGWCKNYYLFMRTFKNVRVDYFWLIHYFC